MAYTNIKKSSDYFNTKLYTGNGSTNAITGVGFQPDWTWIKNRTDASNHNLYDAVRGTLAGKLKSNTTNAESYNEILRHHPLYPKSMEFWKSPDGKKAIRKVREHNLNIQEEKNEK